MIPSLHFNNLSLYDFVPQSMAGCFSVLSMIYVNKHSMLLMNNTLSYWLVFNSLVPENTPTKSTVMAGAYDVI